MVQPVFVACVHTRVPRHPANFAYRGFSAVVRLELEGFSIAHLWYLKMTKGTT
jgi:hypothetical protein